MRPPTVTQRVEQFEEKAIWIEESMADLVTKVAETAITAMKQSLTKLLIEGQTATSRKQHEDLEAVTVRLEGRIGRSREY